MCDPGRYIHKPDVQNKWEDNTYTHTHAHSCKPSTGRAPTKAERAVLGTQHFEHLHNTSVYLMASGDHDERLSGALALAVVVFLTYEIRRRARTSAE